MKATKEDVSKTLSEIAEGLKEISNDIKNGQYDPKKWVDLSSKMMLVTCCLKDYPYLFMEK